MHTAIRGRTAPGFSICKQLTEGLESTPIPPPNVHGSQPNLHGGGSGSPTLTGTAGLGFSSYASVVIPENPQNTGGPR